jgi:hypothetical protein
MSGETTVSLNAPASCRAGVHLSAFKGLLPLACMAGGVRFALVHGSATHVCHSVFLFSDEIFKMPQPQIISPISDALKTDYADFLQSFGIFLPIFSY